MQCPRCQKENVSGHAYCAFCRAELQTGVTLEQPAEAAEPAPKAQQGKGAKDFRRLFRMALNAFLLFIVIAVARGVDWERVKRVISSTKTGVERQVPKPAKPGRAGEEPAKRKANENKTKSKKGAEAEETTGFFNKPNRAQEIAADTSTGVGLTVESVDASFNQEVGNLIIQSHARAKVYIDGLFSGYTPCSVKLVAGAHRISLMVDGYEEWRRSIHLKGNQQMEMAASLTKIANQ
jgi:hypothetical protein